MNSQPQAVGYPPEIAVQELRTAESLVLVSFRLWALCHIHAAGARLPDWRAGLRAAGMEEAARQLFDPLLGVIFAGSRRPIEVHHASCYGISRDEGLFLSCIALYQHQQMSAAEQLLAQWLPPTAARVAASLAMRFAAALEVARLLLPLRRTEAIESHIDTPVTAAVGRGFSLLH